MSDASDKSAMPGGDLGLGQTRPERARSRVPGWLAEIAVTLVIGAVVLLVVSWMQRERQRGGGGALPVATAAPAFAVESIATGAPIEAASFRGRPMVLVFWATWCPACREELPALDQLASEANGRYGVLAVSRESRSVLTRWSSARGHTVPMASDTRGEAFDRYLVESLPTTVIIDGDGRIVHDFSGTADFDVLAEHMARLAR